MSDTPKSEGVFTVSLDFELCWGMRDKLGAAELAPQMAATRKIVPELLRTFDEYDVHATWATVGLLFCDGRDDARAVSPPAPGYNNASLSPYADLDDAGASENDDPTHFAPSLIDRIAATPGQEIGTHTFGHFYCLEDGADVADFEADLAAARTVAERRGHRFTSIVFPRNQYTAAHIDAAGRAGVQAYRGNPPSAIYQARRDDEHTAPVRAARLLDAYFPLTGLNTVPLEALGTEFPINVPATRFVRPYSPKLAALEPAHMRRIATEIRSAARSGHLAHLWWHPHNFAANTEQNFGALRRVLDAFADARERYGMRSLSMSEVAEERAATAA